jgi:hypothetical protein
VRVVVRTLLAIAVVALCATHGVAARTHHHAPKGTAPVSATKSDTSIPQEKNRDPEDVALDRRIKGIYRGANSRPARTGGFLFRALGPSSVLNILDPVSTLEPPYGLKRSHLPPLSENPALP